jgi:hypothetical protein
MADKLNPKGVPEAVRGTANGEVCSQQKAHKKEIRSKKSEFQL